MPISPEDNYPASSGVQDGVTTRLANLQQMGIWKSRLANLQQTGIWKSRLATDDLLPERLQNSKGKNVVVSELQEARSPGNTRERDD